MKSISEIIQTELEKFNSLHAGVSLNHADRAGRSVEKLNRNLKKIAVELDGKDFDSAKVAEVPNCFKKKPVLWKCIGHDLVIEIHE